METRVIVSAIICDGNRILLGKKAKGRPPYPDVWHTLGGGVNDAKKAMDLHENNLYDDIYFYNELKREIKEEANIDIKNIKNICPEFRSKPREAITKNKFNIDTHYIFLEYLCDLDNGLAKPSDDIAELIWIEKENLKSLELTPPSKEMYNELGWLK